MNSSGSATAWRFPPVSDAVTSFLYASAAHVLIAHSVSQPALELTIGVGALFFLAVDWLSRVGIPTSFPDRDQPRRWQLSTQLTKGLTEVICVLSIVTGALSIVDPTEWEHGIAWPAAATVFVAFSYIWNLIVLRVMKKLDLRPLLSALWHGNVFDHEAASEYAEPFVTRVRKSEADLAESFRTSQLSPEAAQRNWKAQIRYRRSLKMVLGGSRVAAQLIAVHIGLANLVAFMLLACPVDEVFILHDVQFLGALAPFAPLVLILLIVLLPWVLYARYSIRRIYGGTDDEWMKRLAGALTTIVPVMFYLSLGRELLVLAIIVQHFLFDLFLLYAVYQPPQRIAALQAASGTAIPAQRADAAAHEAPTGDLL